MSAAPGNRRAADVKSPHNAKDPTRTNRTTTLTEITDRLINNFLKLRCETATSLRLVVGPKKHYQATVAPLEEHEIDQIYGNQVAKQLFSQPRKKLKQQREENKRIREGQKRVLDLMAIPRCRMTRSKSSERIGSETETASTGSWKSGGKSSSCSKKDGRKSQMSSSLWSLGSSNSV